MTWGGYNGYDQSPERLAAATEEAEQALRLQPDLPEAHLAMGYVHYWGNYDLSRGLEEFETAQQLLPNHVEIMEARGFVHRRLGDWPEVYAIFEEATALDPYDADLFQNIGGLTFFRTGRHEAAVRALTRAVELAPDQLLWQVQLGRAYLLGEGQLDSLRATVARLPTDEDPGGVRRQLALFDRDSEQMLQLLQDSDVPDPLYAARAHRFRGDEVAARVAFDSARVRFERLTQEQPDSRGAQAGLGFAYAGLGRADAAAAAAERVAEWNPGDAFTALGDSVRAAEILAQAGLADRAVDLLAQLADTPGSTTGHGLRLDPIWDPIRDHPRFQALLETDR